MKHGCNNLPFDSSLTKLNKREETCDLHVKIILHPRAQCCRVPEWTDVANFSKHSCSIPEIIEENTRTTMKLISSSCGWRVPGNLVWNWGKKKSLFFIVCTIQSAGANVPLLKPTQMTQKPTFCWNQPAAEAASVRKSRRWMKSYMSELTPSPSLTWKVCEGHPFLLQGSRGSRRGNEDTSAVWRDRSDSHDELWLWPTIRERAAKPRRRGGGGGGGQTRGFSLC